MRGKKSKNRIEHGKPSWHADEQIKRIRILMVLVFVLLITVTGVGVWFAYSQIHELAQNGSILETSKQEESSQGEEEALPVYSDSFCLKICSVDDPLEEDEEPELTEYEGVQMDSRIVPALEALLQAADEAGCPMKVTSGYVSPDEQNELYEKEVQRLMKEEKLSQVMAERQAEKTVPKGGCSEGQTGMTGTVSQADDSSTDFEKTEAYNFLVRYAADYGFVFRYPEGSEVITNHDFDPTSLRYVGTKNAQRMREMSMCLEEYVTYRSNAQG